MSNTGTNALLIINPNSRSGAQASIEDGISLLQNAGFNIVQAESHSPQETLHLIEQYHPQIDTVIIGGGDGSIHSAAGALYRHKLTLAILPLGTANDLAKSLGIPPNIAAAFNIIAANNRSRMDLGMVGDHYFFNVANIGLGVDVTRELTAETKKKWGVFSYLKALITAFRNKHTFKAIIKINQKEYRMRSIQVAVGNGRYYGGGNSIDEHASIDDGLLNIYSLQPQTLWELLRQAPLLRSGRHREALKSFCATATRIDIHTIPSREVYADGEPVGKTPTVFKVIPQALTVIRPQTENSPAP